MQLRDMLNRVNFWVRSAFGSWLFMALIIFAIVFGIWGLLD